MAAMAAGVDGREGCIDDGAPSCFDIGEGRIDEAFPAIMAMLVPNPPADFYDGAVLSHRAVEPGRLRQPPAFN